jgi:hypothetical protein
MMRAPVLGKVVCEEKGENEREKGKKKEWTHLKETDSNAHRHTRTPLRPPVRRHRPRVLLQVLENGGEAELALANREEEAGGARESGRRGVGRRSTGTTLTGWRSESEHLNDGFGGVLLGTAEDEGLGALGVAELMNLRLRK